MDYIDLSNNKP